MGRWSSRRCPRLGSLDGPLVTAVDSTGVRVHGASGWIERRHGKKKRYIKVHFAVNVETRRLWRWRLQPMMSTAHRS